MSRASTFFRRLGLGLLGTLAVLVLGVTVTLSIGHVRQELARFGLSFANDVLKGRIEVENVVSVTPWSLRAEGVRIYDASGTQVAEVAALHARLAPLALAQGTLQLRKVYARDAWAELGDLGGPPEALLEAFLPSDPGPEDESSGTFTVRVDNLQVERTRARASYQGRRYRAWLPTLQAHGRYGDSPAVALEALQLEVHEGEQRLLALRAQSGRWEAQSGGGVELRGTLVSAPLSLSAQFPGLDGESAWPIEHAELHLQDVRPSTLDALGLNGDAYLASSVSVHAEAHRQAETLAVRTRLETAEGGLRLRGTVTRDTAELKLRLAPTQLASVSPQLPAMRAQGRLDLDLRHGQAPEVEVTLRSHDVQLDGSRLPDVQARVRYDAPRVELQSLSLQDVRGELKASGHYDTESSAASLTLSARALALDSLPLPFAASGRLNASIAAERSADGRVKADVQLQGDHGLQLSATEWRDLTADLSLKLTRDGSLAGGGEISFATLTAGSLQTKSGTLEVALAGAPGAPEMHVDARIRAPRLGELEARRATLDLRGSLQGATAELSVEGKERERLGLHVDARRQGETLLGQARGEARLGEHTWKFDLQRAKYTGGAVTVRGLSARCGPQRLSAEGRLSEANRVQARVSLEQLRLGPLTRLAGVQEVAGELSGQLRARGAAARPVLTADLEFDGLSSAGIEPIRGQLALDLDVPGGQARLTTTLRPDADVERDEADEKLDTPDVARAASETLEVDALAAFARAGRFPDLAALKRADYTLELRAEQIDLARVVVFAPAPLSALRGHLSSRLDLEGTLQAPRGDGFVEVAIAQAEDEPVQRLRAELDLSESDTHIELVARQAKRVIASIELQHSLGAEQRLHIVEDPVALLEQDFDLDLLLKETRLDRLGGGYAHLLGLYGLDQPVRASTTLHFEAREGKVEGDGTSRLVVFNRAMDGGCALDATSQLDVSLSLREEQLSVNLDAVTQESGEVDADLRMPLSLRDLLDGGSGVGSAQVSMDAHEVALHEVPGLCALRDGVASMTLKADGLGGDTPEGQATLDVESLRLRDEPASAFHASFDTSPDHVRGKGTFEVDSQRRGHFEVELPVALSGTPGLRYDAPLHVQLVLDSLPVAPLMTAVNAVGQVQGAISADLKLEGSLNAPRPKGYVEFEELSLSIASLAQPFRRVTGRVRIEDRSLELSDIVAHDKGGELRLSGTAKLNDDGSGEADVKVEAEDFPLRRQGTVIAEANTSLHARATMSPERAIRMTAEILDGRLWLTGDQGDDVQSLEPMPEIRYARGNSETQTEDVELSVKLARLTVKTRDDLWLQHKDFSVQVGCDIVVRAAEEATLTGSVWMKRGELNLLGNAFVIDEGEITFTGDSPPEPQLDIQATHTLPDGDELHVAVTGRVSAPDLRFSGAATTAGEALAALTGVGNTESQASAQSQASDFAINMLAGLLSMTARRKYGEWVPLLAVDSSTEGIERLRAGFDASDLIPEFLDDIATGMYVEGIVGSGRSQSQQDTLGGVGLGVSVELSFPYDLITSGSYGPGSTWTADFGWAP